MQFNTVHRQSDGAFIQILNAIRAGTCDAIELEALNIAIKQPVTHADIRCDAQVVEFMQKLTGRI